MKKNNVFMAVLLGLACIPFAIESHPPTRREAKRVFRNAPTQLANGEISFTEYSESVKFANGIGGFVQRPYHDPLHIAACQGNSDLVVFLFLKGADPKFVGPSGESALDAATARNNAEIQRLFGINNNTTSSWCTLY